MPRTLLVTCVVLGLTVLAAPPAAADGLPLPWPLGKFEPPVQCLLRTVETNVDLARLLNWPTGGGTLVHTYC